MTWVYFIQHGGPEGHIKIGTTTSNPHARLRALQTGAPEPLVLLAAIPGDARLEHELHERFATIRVRPDGEWFRAASDLLVFIEGARCARRFEPDPMPGEKPDDPSSDDIAFAAAAIVGAQTAIEELILAESTAAAAYKASITRGHATLMVLKNALSDPHIRAAADALSLKYGLGTIEAKVSFLECLLTPDEESDEAASTGAPS